MNFLANLLVIPRWGINGAAMTSSIAYLIVLLIVMGYYLRYTESRLRDVVLPKSTDIRSFVEPPHPDELSAPGHAANPPALSSRCVGGGR